MVLTYTNWGLGEPNNLGGENALVGNWYAGNRWNHWTGGSSTFYIIEYGPVQMTIPEPSSAWLVLAAAGFVVARKRKSV